ncbi:hypothetical protein [Streptomyces griseomycini]|uniref:Uncharacterized protein n=1 Tax=Streptomyces griseomycini TaxID=66895 RepID=A0A7W7VAE8_9ACTN|nr:hypothetical protein [Streptomyces griseomycini]MBB4903043.1 hypothetical protein [Streptomyces griseomycini]GGR50568.1 hypothetical protein GCM10015536_65130 [Streptomyces griseomycini]
MTVTLGELYDVVHDRLERVTSVRLPGDDPFAHALALRQVDTLVKHVHLLLRQPGDRIDATADDTFRHLHHARRALDGAARWLPPIAPDSAANDGPLGSAVEASGAVIDLIRGHRDGTGAPVTPYALAFTTRSAQAYHLRHASRILHSASRIVHAVSQTLDNWNASVRLQTAHASLQYASVQARHAGADADPALAAFPQALPLTPVPALSTDPLTRATDRIRDDCEQLSRAAYETLHGRSARPLSGSDLQLIIRWRSLGTMLAGRLLVQAAAEAPNEAGTSLRSCADRFRSAAHAWRNVRERWDRVVDVDDPRIRPRLPRPSYEMVHRGQIFRMPQGTVPHPAVEIARATALRAGRLLFGGDWDPDSGNGPPRTRSAPDIVADSGGIAELAQTAYRLTATDWRIAVAAPRAVMAIEHRLLTDIPEHRPADHPYRFYPLHGHQLERIRTSFQQVCAAQQAAAQSLLAAAPDIGMDTSRAVLDATAHRHITAQTWAPVPAPNPVARGAIARGAAAPQPATPGRGARA